MSGGQLVSVESIARKWHDHLLSTDPIDHGRAEAAIRSVYRAAESPEPERFVWCESPMEAVWAALVIIGRTDGYNHAVLEDVERSKAGKEKLARARTMVAERLGIAEAEVEGCFGKPFYRAEGSSPVGKRLTDDSMASWMARAEAGDDLLAIHKRGPFKPLYDLEQALHFEGYQFRNGVQQGSLYKEALAKAGNKHIAILGGRSAHHRLYGNLAYSEVAIDEALAEAGKLELTELQRAIREAYEACGLWWPCERGAVLAERPIAAKFTAQGPQMEWADGFVIGEGKPSAKAAAKAAPASAPAETATVNRAKLLSASLPANRADRIAYLRSEASSLPHLDRYLAGEHEQVWRDLIALDQAALSDAHAADALAVAYETMHRVEANVRVIAERLRSLGYRFVYPGSGGGFFGLGKPREHQPHVPPQADVRATLDELEEVAGGPIPLSLRAFFEVVGEINFNGDHPSLAPKDTDVTPDPLMVCSAEDALAMTESRDRDDDDLLLVEFAPDALHKANISGGGPYYIEIPQPGADASVEDAPQDVMFVEYLRIALLGWGGFPGWEQAGSAPQELELLREGLVGF
jgi:hypothetical protein